MASTSDDWGFSVSSGPSRADKRVSVPVKDDWDDDEEEEEDPQKVWEDANNKPPMPELVICSHSGAPAAPPAAALQPTMRILKRPTATAADTSPGASSTLEQQKTYADREAQYQAARERIFGDSGTSTPNSAPGIPSLLAKPAGSSNDTPASSSQPSRQPMSQVATTSIIRDPRGPDSTDPGTSGRGNSRGFRGRRSANPARATSQGVAK